MDHLTRAKLCNRVIFGGLSQIESDFIDKLAESAGLDKMARGYLDDVTDIVMETELVCPSEVIEDVQATEDPSGCHVHCIYPSNESVEFVPVVPLREHNILVTDYIAPKLDGYAAKMRVRKQSKDATIIDRAGNQVVYALVGSALFDADYDCEVVEHGVFVVDVSMYDGNDVTKLRFGDRLAYIFNFAIQHPSNFAVFYVTKQDHVPLWCMSKARLTKLLNRPECDGVIFSDGDAYYSAPGAVRSWKHRDRLTVDMIVMKLPSKSNGFKAIMGVVDKGINIPYATVAAKTVLRIGQIWEMSQSAPGDWGFFRIREDKVTPNSWRVANEVCELINKCETREGLINIALTFTKNFVPASSTDLLKMSAVDVYSYSRIMRRASSAPNVTGFFCDDEFSKQKFEMTMMRRREITDEEYQRIVDRGARVTVGGFVDRRRRVVSPVSDRIDVRHRRPDRRS